MNSRNAGDSILRKEIKIILSSVPQKKTSYNIYLPVEITKKDKPEEITIDSTYAERQAIYLITHHNIHTIVPIIEEIILELQQTKCEYLKADRLHDVQQLLNQLQIQPFNNALYPLLKIIKDTAKTLRKMKHNEVLAIEFTIYLEGLFLQIDIALKRQKMKAVEESKALQFLTLLEAEEALPVILVILHEILVINEKTVKDQRTKEATAYAIQLLNDANEKLYLSKTELIAALSELKDQIIPNLKKLVELIPNMVITEPLVSSAKELSQWLEGLYLHTLTEKERTGFFGNIKNKMIEATLRSTTGFTKLDLALYYHLAASTLNELLEQYAQTLPQEAVEPVVQPKVEPAIVAPSLDENKLMHSDIKILKDHSEIQVLTTLTKADAGKLNQIIDAIQSILGETVEQKFWKMLESARHSSTEIKLNTLYNALMAFPDFELSENQRRNLLHLEGAIRDMIDCYNSNTYLKSYLGEYSEKWFPRAHKNVADDIISKIEINKSMRAMILVLFVAKSELRKPKNTGKVSQQLLPDTIELLKNIYEHLLNSVPFTLKLNNVVPSSHKIDEPHRFFAGSLEECKADAHALCQSVKRTI